MKTPMSNLAFIAAFFIPVAFADELGAYKTARGFSGMLDPIVSDIRIHMLPDKDLDAQTREFLKFVVSVDGQSVVPDTGNHPSANEHAKESARTMGGWIQPGREDLRESRQPARGSISQIAGFKVSPRKGIDMIEFDTTTRQFHYPMDKLTEACRRGFSG